MIAFFGILLLYRNTNFSYVFFFNSSANKLAVFFRYVATPVERKDDCEVFMLRQGIQKRIVVTLVHETNSKLMWKEATNAFVGQLNLLYKSSNVLAVLLASSLAKFFQTYNFFMYFNVTF